MENYSSAFYWFKGTFLLFIGAPENGCKNLIANFFILMLVYCFILFPLMKKYAKNLGKMMLLPANANACPPFYPPARLFAYGEIGGVSY
jgi:hypothetical protein